MLIQDIIPFRIRSRHRFLRKSTSFFCPNLKRGLATMYFTNGSNRAIEMLMRERWKRIAKRRRLFASISKRRKKSCFLRSHLNLPPCSGRPIAFTALPLSHTLNYAQSLYEKCFLTYSRTDSNYLASDMEQTVTELVVVLFLMLFYAGCVEVNRANNHL